MSHRFKIVKEQWVPDGIDCEHPLCERFHAKGCPEPALRTEWLIIDPETEERANFWDGEATYPLKREAVASLNKHLAREEKE